MTPCPHQHLKVALGLILLIGIPLVYHSWPRAVPFDESILRPPTGIQMVQMAWCRGDGITVTCSFMQPIEKGHTVLVTLYAKGGESFKQAQVVEVEGLKGSK